MMNEICVMSNNEKISPLLKGKILKYERNRNLCDV